MATVTITAERVTHAGKDLRAGDTLDGKDANLRPLVDAGAARWGTAPVTPDVWDQTVSEVRAAVEDMEDVDRLRAWHAREADNPSHEGGRVGVRNAIEERLGELNVDDPSDGLARGPEA